jgi:DNA-binding response OmpR family regulator
MSGCSILIVEDDPGAADVFVPVLTVHGYEVRVEMDADAGLREMQRRRPSAMLVDLHLPGVNGLEFLRRARSNGDLAGVPVAMMTGDYLLDDRMQGELQALGVPLYFKPLWEEDLVAIVERLIAQAGELSARCEEMPVRIRSC